MRYLGLNELRKILKARPLSSGSSSSKSCNGMSGAADIVAQAPAESKSQATAKQACKSEATEARQDVCAGHWERDSTGARRWVPSAVGQEVEEVNEV
jgi:hypothetical protein